MESQERRLSMKMLSLALLKPEARAQIGTGRIQFRKGLSER